jgi:hypothetical protein
MRAHVWHAGERCLWWHIVSVTLPPTYTLLVLRQMAPSSMGDVVVLLQEKLQQAAAQLDTLQQEVQQLSVARVRDHLPEGEYSLHNVQHPSMRNGSALLLDRHRKAHRLWP